MMEVWQEKTVAEIEEELNTNSKWGMTSDLVSQKKSDKPKKQAKGKMIQFFLSAVADPFHILMLIVSLILMVQGRAVFGTLAIVIMLIRSLYMTARRVSYESAKIKAQKLRIPNITVLRDGEEQTISADLTAEGDIVILRAGDIVYFPLKIAENDGLIFLPQNAEQDYEITDDDKAVNVALPGMKVAFGEGKGIVLDSTFTSEEFEQDEKLPNLLTGTPLLVWTAVSLFLSLLASAVSIAKGNDVIDCAVSAVGLFLVTCPLSLPDGFKLCSIEGLKKINSSAVLTPLCAKKLREAKYIGLGENDIASKKLKFRGVITSYNEFNADYPYSGQDRAVLKMIEEMACLCTNAELKNGLYDGSLQEKAIIEGSSSNGVFKELLVTKYPRLFEKQTDSHQTVGVKIQDGVRVISMGEPREILSMCDSFLADGEVLKITDEMQSEMLKKEQELKDTGNYVTALAFSDNEKDTGHEKTNLCFLGLILVSHQADSSKLSFIKKCRSANLKPLLFTALEKENAEVIASFYTKNPYILSGEELDSLTDRDLKHIISKADGFAGLSAQQKVRALSMLKENGQAVLYPAVTADDILFQSKAYVSIAPDNASQNLKRMCDGTVQFMEQIPEIKKATVNLYRNQNNLLGHNIAIKSGILISSLLTALCLPYGQNEFLQYLWLGIFIMPLTNYMILKAEDNSKGINEKSAMRSSIISGAIIGALAFIVSLISYFSASEMVAKGMMFFIFVSAVLVFGHSSQTTRLLVTDALKNKNGIVSATSLLILTFVISFVPPLAESFSLTGTNGFSILFAILFIAILTILSDIMKWIEYKINKKEIQNGR